jgi:acyl carrier protein
VSEKSERDPFVAELANKIVEALNLSIEPATLDLDAPIVGAGLGIDSIDALEIAVMVEQQYCVRLRNQDAREGAFNSIRALAAHIQSRRAIAAS